MYKALKISPMIPSYDFEITKNFFVDIFGFEVVMDSNVYMIFSKSDLTVHILRAGPDIGQMEFYLEVDDLEVLWDSIKNKLIGIKVREPFDREYGMREAHIEIPGTKTLLFAGMVIK